MKRAVLFVALAAACGGAAASPGSLDSASRDSSDRSGTLFVRSAV